MSAMIPSNAAMNDLLLQPDQPLPLSGKRVHFVGIGGCGMSGLARIVQAAGAVCSGTDSTPGGVVDSLIAGGIPVALKQEAASVPADCDLMVISAAIRPEHPEVAHGRTRGIAVLKYAQMVGRMMLGRTGVAIAGTHGKSTTTAMLAHILIQCGMDPTFIVGATCDQIGGGARVGRNDLLIAEACEFDRSFHNFHPTHSVVLNVEEDHLEIYGTLDAVVQSFRTFAARTAPEGSLLIGHDGAHRTTVASGLSCPVETIGFAPQADWQVVVDRSDRAHPQRVTLKFHDRQITRFDCRLPGEHMACNACAAAVTARRLGAEWDAIAAALGTFQGLDRRMQVLGTTAGGVTVIDDYGHHPTEIDTTLRALRAHHRPQDRQGRLICVFQPHQHARTRFLMEQFTQSFSQADVVIVPPIYFVRDTEADRRAVTSADLVYKLQQRGVLALHIEQFQDIVSFLRAHCRPHDLLVVMGAGPVWKIAHEYFAQP
jgi:UDP-N-acetylmuramate--alanine ligase